MAALQIEVFVPEADPMPLIPMAAMLQQLFVANQQQQRRAMVLRLANDLRTRVEKGSDLLVAAVPLDPPQPDEELAAIGQYGEVGVQLLGTVDLSSQELQLPTHSLVGGLYLSHMAVAPLFRRQVSARFPQFSLTDQPASARPRGVWVPSLIARFHLLAQGLGRQLLQAAEAAAIERDAEGIFLHVEPSNEAAISLYQQAGFSQQSPRDPAVVSFMKALKLEARQPLLMFKELPQRQRAD